MEFDINISTFQSILFCNVFISIFRTHYDRHY